MKGWKTWTGIAGFFITHIAGAFLGVDMGVAQEQSVPLVNLVNAAFGALTVIGLGHKIEKAQIAVQGKF